MSSGKDHGRPKSSQNSVLCAVGCRQCAFVPTMGQPPDSIPWDVAASCAGLSRASHACSILTALSLLIRSPEPAWEAATPVYVSLLLRKP